MAFLCLQSFLQHLEQEGELRLIKEPVSTLVEINRFVQKEVVSESPTPSQDAQSYDSGREQVGGQALLFEEVVGCDFPVAINVFGSYYRMEQALGGGGFDMHTTCYGKNSISMFPLSDGTLVRNCFYV